MIDAGAVLDSIAEYAHAKTATSAQRINRIAVIDPAYASGAPKVTFEGDSTMSASGFVCLPGYSPVAADRVLMLPVGNTYVIAGKPTSTPIAAVSVTNENSAYLETGSSSYTTLTGNPGHSFVAPASGSVLVSIKAALVGVGAGSVAAMSFKIGTGATIGGGTVVFAAADDNRIASDAAGNAIECGAATLVTGLTPGDTYNAQALYKRSGGTGNVGFSRRRINIIPA